MNSLPVFHAVSSQAARPKPLPKKKEEEDKDVASTTAPAPAKPAAPRGGAASAGKRAASGFKPGQLDPTSPLLQPTKKPASQVGEVLRCVCGGGGMVGCRGGG